MSSFQNQTLDYVCKTDNAESDMLSQLTVLTEVNTQFHWNSFYYITMRNLLKMKFFDKYQHLMYSKILLWRAHYPTQTNKLSINSKWTTHGLYHSGFKLVHTNFHIGSKDKIYSYYFLCLLLNFKKCLKKTWAIRTKNKLIPKYLQNQMQEIWQQKQFVANSKAQKEKSIYKDHRSISYESFSKSENTRKYKIPKLWKIL